jgi:SAM-dependent methyltransferase
MKKQELEFYKEISENEFTLFDYSDSDGQFDYEFYKNAQDHLNKKKIDLNGPSEPLVKQLCHYLKREYQQANIQPSLGLCHGTRRGHEQKWFSKHLGFPILGTDIAESAEQFPMTIQWDFHDVKPQWVNKMDFIYSNSLDHSYDPVFCLRQWFRCLKVGGICVLGWSKDNEGIGRARGIVEAPEDNDRHDCFLATVDFYEKIINIAGTLDGTTGLKYTLNTEYMGGLFGDSIVWDMQNTDWGLQDKHLIIQKFADMPPAALQQNKIHTSKNE